jgi:lysophospholipase L1-like esterase
MKQSGKTIREYNQPDDDSLRGRNYLFVTGDSTPAKNAKELKDTYALAALIKPNKLARSATNRITIVVAPGIYTFGTSKFALNAGYIDLVSLTGNRDIFLDGLTVMANWVFIKGIDCGTNEITFTGNFPDTVFENCKALGFEVGSGMSSVYVDDSLQGDGKVDTPIGIRLSDNIGNQLVTDEKGLYVPTPNPDAGGLELHPETYVPLDLLGYIDYDDGTYHDGNFYLHRSSEFQQVSIGDNIILASNLTIGSAAKFINCYDEFYNFTHAVTTFPTVDFNGFVRFCCSVDFYTTSSFLLKTNTISGINNTIAAIQTKSLQDMDLALPLVYNDGDMFKGLRTSDLTPSINTQGQTYLYDNAGVLELRMVKDAENIVGVALTQKFARTITPASFSIVFVGDSIMGGVNTTISYPQRILNKLVADGHTVTASEIYGWSGFNLVAMAYNVKYGVQAHYDNAVLMSGINDAIQWISVNGLPDVNGSILEDDFRAFFRYNLDRMITQMNISFSFNKLFLVVENHIYLPDVTDPGEILSVQLYGIIKQEILRAATLNSKIYICRADYYLQPLTPTNINYLHPTDAGAELMAIGTRNEITYNV